MAEYDGSIRINTKIESKDVTSQMQRIVNSIRKSESEIQRLQARMDELANTKLPTVEYTKLQKELSSATKEMENLISQDDRLSDIDAKIKRLSKSAAGYAAKMKEIASQKIPTQEYNSAIKEVKKLDKSLRDALTSKERFLETGGNESNRTFKGIEYDIEKLEVKLRQAVKDIKSLVDNGKAFTFGTDTEKYQNLSTKYEQVNQELEKQKGIHSEIAQKQAKSVQKAIELRSQINQLVQDGKAFTLGTDTEEYAKSAERVRELSDSIEVSEMRLSELQAKQMPISEGFDKMKTSANKAFNAINEGGNVGIGVLTNFSKKIKAIALTVFIFNLIRKAFNAMVDGMKAGFSNFMDYSSDFANTIQTMKNAMSTLGNQIAAAFAPIVSLVIPWITKLINAISTAMTYVAQFIAILGGKSTFTRAKQVQDSYNKSLGNTAKAADKARGALAKFDDLDVLEKKQEDTGSGGAGAVGDMFEEVPVDSKFKDWLDGILKKLKPILDYLKELKDIFMEGFWDGLGDWEYRWEIIKDSIASIKESLIDIFTDPAVVAAADAWVQSLVYMFGSLAGSLASIGLTIGANLLGGIAGYLDQNKDRIKNYFIEMFNIWEEVNYLFADLFQSIAYIFEAFSSESGQQLTTNIIGIFVDAFMGITELASNIFLDIANIIIQLFVDNQEAFRTALEGFLDVLADVTGTIKNGIDETFDKLNEVYNEHFKPFFDSVAQGLSDLVAKFLEFWNRNVQPILEKWAAKFDELWTAHIQPLVNNVAEFLGSIADLIKVLWESVLQPLVEWIIDNVLPTLMPILETIYNTLVTVFGGIADLFSGLISTVTSIIDTIVALVNGDWSAAWESAKSIVTNAFETILSFVQTIFDSFIGVVGTALQTIVGTIKVTVLGIFDFLVNIWNNIYTTFTTIITAIVEWFTENWNSFSEFITETWNNIVLFFTETWENIQLLFDTFLEFLVDVFVNSWKESWETAQNLFQIFHDLISKLSDAIKNLFTGLMKSVKLLIDGDWKGAWENAKEVFSAFKTKVNEIIGTIREILESFFGWISDAISGVLEKLSSIGSSIKNVFSGGGEVAGASVASASYASYSLDNIPHLASGSVIRGGNPFIAMLGDQPAGQTNIEAPLDTIKQAVKEELAASNLNTTSINPVISLNVDGQEFARLTLGDFLNEMQRQGYDVDILGVT